MEYALAVEPVMVVDLLAVVVELIVVVVVTWQPVAESRQEQVMAVSNCRRR